MASAETDVTTDVKTAAVQPQSSNAKSNAKRRRNAPKPTTDDAAEYAEFKDHRERSIGRLADRLSDLLIIIGRNGSESATASATASSSAAASESALAAASASAAASESASAAATESAASGSAISKPAAGSQLLYDLLYGKPTDPVRIDRRWPDLRKSDWLLSVRQLKPATDESLRLLESNLETELAYITTEIRLRKFGTGLTIGAAKVAVRMKRSIGYMLKAFDADRPRHRQRHRQRHRSSASGSGSSSGSEASGTDLDTDGDDSNQTETKLAVCVGCDQQKNCATINVWIVANRRGRRSYLAFDFGLELEPDAMVERRPYQEKFADFFCCHCGVAVLRCLARDDLLSGIRRNIEIDDLSLAVGNVGCRCAECGLDETDITTAYDRRILLLKPADNDDGGGDGSDRPTKKTKTDPADDDAAKSTAEPAAAASAAAED